MFPLTDRPEHKLVEETARRFANERVRPSGRPGRNLRPAFRKLCQAACELGLSLSALPIHLGGLDLDPALALNVSRILATGDPAIAFSLPQPGLFAELLLLLGSATQQQEWLESFSKAAERTWGAVIVPAPNTPPTLEATELADGSIKVSGTTSDIFFSPWADRLFFLARKPSGALVACVSPLPVTGITLGASRTLLGLNCAAAAPIILADLVVPIEQQLRAGDPEVAVARAVARQGLRIAAYSVGAARAAAKLALERVEAHREAGKPIEQFQVLGFLLADMHKASEASSEALLTSAQNPPNGAAEALLDARDAAESMAVSVVESAMHILASLECPETTLVGRWLEDVRALRLVNRGRGGSRRSPGVVRS